jgi:hypothetical protein
MIDKNIMKKYVNKSRKVIERKYKILIFSFEQRVNVLQDKK